MKRQLLALGLVFALPLAARADTSVAKPVVVPFDLLPTKHMVVKIKVNGKGPYPVIFDTGAPVTLLNNKVAKEAGLLKKMAKPLFSLWGSAGPVRIQTLQVGDLKVEDVPAIVMDHPTVEELSKRTMVPLHGIVGFPFFARYKMTLDYQAKQMTFVPNGYDPPDVMQELTATLMTMMQDKQPAAKVLAPAAQWGLVLHKESGDEEAGVTIREVLPDSAAAKAGLKPGDRLLTLDKRWTDSVADCYAAAGYVKPGVNAKVTVKRADKEMELTVKPLSGL